MMKHILILISFFYFGVYRSFAQNDTIKMYVSVDGKHKIVNKKISCTLIADSVVYKNCDSTFIIDTGQFKAKYVAMDFAYKKLRFHTDTIPNFFKHWNYEVVIKKRIKKGEIEQPERIRFIYFLRFFERLSKDEINAGNLYPVLRTSEVVIFKS